MIKKLSASLFALALVACVAAPAAVQAQDTIGIYYDAAGTLQRFGNTTPGVPFTVSVVAKKDDSSVAGEFVMTEIQVAFPSVFKLSTTKINNTNLDLGDNSLGEYLMAYATCAAAGELELVRVQYLDATGALPADLILTLRGFQPGDTRPSSFGGVPGYVDCAENKLPLTLEPWVDFDTIDPTKGPNGVANSDGVMVLNADTTPTEGGSVGALKARF